jgi:hypothetical protein
MGMQKKLADASKANISSMEDRLLGTLKPIAPRHEFVHGLGRQIQARNQATLVNQVSNWHILLALIAGFVALAALLAMVTRALMLLSGKRNTA